MNPCPELTSRPLPPAAARQLISGLLCGALCLGACLLFPTEGWSWGYAVHRLINRNAVSNLPPDFQGFAQWADELEQLATAADERKDSTPGEDIKHYIDIDEYNEFFTHSFPHTYTQAVSQYGLSRLESNGIGPWALDDTYEELVQAFKAKDWTTVVAKAADIGHYAGDLHQPLHLTRNFDGQETGQNGIHSRFESRLTGRHMADFTPFLNDGVVLADPLARTFQWIDATYPGVAEILGADRAARAEANGSTSSDVYYNTMWEILGQDTWSWIGQASLDIASIWYTAWLEAGSPPLPGSSPTTTMTWSGIKALY